MLKWTSLNRSPVGGRGYVQWGPMHQFPQVLTFGGQWWDPIIIGNGYMGSPIWTDRQAYLRTLPSHTSSFWPNKRYVGTSQLNNPPPQPQEDWMGKCLFLNHLTNYLEYNASKMLSKWGANAEKLDVENQPCWQIHRFLHYKVIHSSHQWWPIEVQSITESV